MKKLIAFALVFISSIAVAQDVGWRDKKGNFTPNTDASKSVNGFGGLIVVTPDQDWKEKWDTPAEHIPHFNEAKDVNSGQKLTILIFFSNPKPDVTGHLNITCDIKVTRPDKSYAIDANDVNCANWEVPPKQYKYNTQLCNAVIEFVGKPQDLPGEWQVYINLKDKNAGIEVPLKTKFNLSKKS